MLMDIQDNIEICLVVWRWEESEINYIRIAIIRLDEWIEEWRAERIFMKLFFFIKLDTLRLDRISMNWFFGGNSSISDSLWNEYWK